MPLAEEMLTSVSGSVATSKRSASMTLSLSDLDEYSSLALW